MTPEGRPYFEALREAEPGLRIRLTRPPYPCAGSGTLRVVAVRPGPEWVLAYERYLRLTPRRKGRT